MHKSLALQQILSPAFDITFDCENDAAIDQGCARVELVAALISSDGNHFNRIDVRIHDPNHDVWMQGVDILVGPADRRLAYITVPRVRDVVGVARVTDRINQAAKATDIARHLSIHALTEARGTLAQMFDIASLVQVKYLSFSLMDSISAHDDTTPSAVMGSPEQFKHPLIRRALAGVSAAYHAHGKVLSHNVSTNIKHPDRAGTDAAHARNEFGYLHKWDIHSDRIAPIVSAFRPSHEEVTHMSAILASAQGTAWGPIQHEGRLYDRASYHYW